MVIIQVCYILLGKNEFLKKYFNKKVDMKFFNYIFYRIYCLYKYKFKDEDPILYALVIITFLQTFNLICTFAIFTLFNPLVKEINKIYGLILFILILFINIFYYIRKKRYIDIFEYWKGESVANRRIKGSLVLFYILCTIILGMLFLFYIGGLI
jgi:hypothetical protein